ncbi:MAG TPA: DciA family protein [Xanthobacteraceae bacterium]|jgi:hypothetical protein|nr:DciA family protein [Xanthobacteraceae bacterium]
MTEPRTVNKSRFKPVRPLSALLAGQLKDMFARQGFASAEIVTRWSAIVGADIAALTQPVKIQWPRGEQAEVGALATLVIRVEGPMALEIQHSGGQIVERVNRFFGWQAIGRIAIRQAPLSRRTPKKVPRGPSAAEIEAATTALTGIEDADLRAALGRLGASVKKK